MDHTPETKESVTAPSTRTLLLLGGRRPRPSFADALSAGGGIIVSVGVFLVALDIYTESGDGWTGALLFVVLMAASIGAMVVAPRAVQPGCMSALVLSVPAIYGFLVFPTADSFGDVRVFVVLTIATWGLLYVVSNAKGRPILIGLTAALLYLWMLGEVAETGAYFAAPVPSPPYATPVALLDGMRGGPDARPAAFSTQETTLDDLDTSDPLYPLAEDCAAGDLETCDALWSQADVGSDFEAFAESCGGDAAATYPCASGSGGEGGQIGEFDSGIDPFAGDPLDTTPLGPQGDKALEIGLVSLLFGAAYLAAVRILDRQAFSATATALVLPAIGALVVAAAALGDASDSAVLGGLLTLAIGIAIGVTGFFGRDRRFTTWAGGAIASVGALIVAVDIAPESSPAGDNADLVGTGIVVLLFGLAVVAMAWLVHRALETTPDSQHSPAPPEPPEPDVFPI